MSADDELTRLRAAFAAQTPAPDAGRRAAVLAQALAHFDEIHARPQEMAAPLRPEKDRSRRAALVSGRLAMLDKFTSPAALAATASVAVLGLGFALLPPASLPISGEGEPSRQVGEQITGQITEQITAAPPAPLRPAALESAPMAAEGQAMRRSRVGMQKMQAVAPAAMPQPAPEGAFGDQFIEHPPNGVQLVAEAPVSTFSVDVDTASWSYIRRALRAGQMPVPEAVRIEEMVNYFPYDYPLPEAGGAPFALSIARFASPWSEGRDLVRIALQGEAVAAERPPLDLVFLIDTSGSMQGEDRLGLLKTAFALLLGQLGPEDQVAIVSYAGSAGEVLAPTPASDRGAILGALQRLEAGGGTAGAEGLEQAYQLAQAMGAKGGRLGRIVLATDGDFNIGPSEPEALKRYVADKRAGGVGLSVLGFGRGNLDDALMQALAQNGNGQAAYIDSAEEAQKVMVDQAAGLLHPIAGDVKLQVEWNPAEVADYRLIGYESRALARRDFDDDRVDAGDIGAGHQVTALYEITPADSPARQVPPLRYGVEPKGVAGAEAGWLRLRYKRAGAEESALIEAPVPVARGQADQEARFAAAIAGFGELLRGSGRPGQWDYGDAIALAESARGEDRFGWRASAIALMRLAQSLTLR